MEPDCRQQNADTDGRLGRYRWYRSHCGSLELVSRLVKLAWRPRSTDRRCDDHRPISCPALFWYRKTAELPANRVRGMGLRSCGRHCCPLHGPLLFGGSCRINCRRCKLLRPINHLWLETKGPRDLGVHRLSTCSWYNDHELLQSKTGTFPM